MIIINVALIVFKAALTMVFGCWKMFSGIETIFSKAENAVEVAENIFSTVLNLVWTVKTTFFVVLNTVGVTQTRFSEAENIFYVSETGFSIEPESKHWTLHPG